MNRSRAGVLWSSRDNPPDSIARQLGMQPRHFTRALHKIKSASNLSGDDRVTIYNDGGVTDDKGELLGNLHDED